MAVAGIIGSAVATTHQFVSSSPRSIPQHAGTSSKSSAGIIDVGDLPDGIIDVGDLPDGIIDIGDLPDGVSALSIDRLA